MSQRDRFLEAAPAPAHSETKIQPHAGWQCILFSTIFGEQFAACLQ